MPSPTPRHTRQDAARVKHVNKGKSEQQQQQQRQRDRKKIDLLRIHTTLTSGNNNHNNDNTDDSVHQSNRRSTSEFRSEQIAYHTCIPIVYLFES